MPPPIKEPVTFLGWIEDLFKVSIRIPKQTYSVWIKRQRGGFVFLIEAPSPSAAGKSALISAFVESPEAFRDTQGVNTKLGIEDVIKNPFETLNALGKDTLKDIFRLDDVAEMGRSEIIEALTRGETTVNGHDLQNPYNLSLGIAKKIGLPVSNVLGLIDPNPAIGSKITLLKDINAGVPGTSPKFEDRKIAEEGGNRESQYKTYTLLSGALTGMAGAYENPSTVLAYRDDAVFAYNRTVMSELGMDLEKVMPTTSAKKIWDQNLGRVVDPVTGRRVGGFKVLSQSEGSFRATLNASPGGNPLLKLEHVLANANGTDLPSALGITPAELASMTPEVKDIHVSFLRSEFRKLGIDQKIDPNDPDQKKRISTIGESNLQRTHEQTRLAMELQLKIEAYKREINATVKAKILAQKPSLIATEVANRNAAMVAGVGHGPLQIVGGVLVPMARPWTPHDLTLDGTELRIDTQLKAQADRALDRLRAATKSMDTAHNLYFAATTKNLLEAIEKGSFLNTFFISARFAGSLPFISKTIWDGRNNPVIARLDNGMNWLDNHDMSPKKIMELGGFVTGVAFEANASDLKGFSKLTAIESQITVEWKTPAPGPVGSHVWHQQTVTASEGAGIFGDWGVYDTANRAYGSNGKLLRDNLIPIGDFSNPDDLFSDRVKIRTFFDNLISESEVLKLNGGIPNPASPYQNFAKEFGVVTTNTVTDPITGVVTTVIDDASLVKLKSQYTAYTSGTGGENLLFTTLNNPGGVPATERWAFLKLIDKQGKIDQFTKQYMGVLNWYNRKANAAQSFIYKQILFGKYGGNNALIKGLIKISTPVRKLLENFGFKDDIMLAEAISNWNFVRRFSIMGKILQSPKVGTAPALKAIGKLGGKFFAKGVAALASKAGGRILLQSLGYLISGLGGALSGGIGWVIVAVGDVAWKFGKNVLTLNFKKAVAESKEAFQGKLDVLKKVILYPLVCCCGCILAPIGLILIVIASQLAPLNPFGGGNFKDSESKMLSVKKEAVRSGTNIQYTITITNISENDAVDIESISDTLNFTFPCPGEGGSGETVTYPNNTPEFTWNVNPDDFPAGKTGTVTKATPMVLIYTVSGDKTKGTYFNFIEIKAKNEPNKSATASIGTDMQGGGGCVKCPAGWPFVNYKGALVVTQGPYTTSSHSTSEAVDIAPNYGYNPNNGQQISATHRGIVWFQGLSGGYGNLAVVRSPAGFSTYYAHMDRFNPSISNGQLVDKGTVLGIMGTTGNSTGTHLHYEFRSPGDDANYQCLSGYVFQLNNVQGESYVPKSIVRGCTQIATCGNMAVP